MHRRTMLIAACLVLTLCLAGAQGQGCPGGQEWNDCGSPCTKVCWDRAPMCIEMCVPKCECPKDTYWHAMDQNCYPGETCDIIGLKNGTEPPYWANWATTTTKPSPATSDPRYCDWCPGGACDENWNCMYVTTTARPDGYCDWCLFGACNENRACLYGTTQMPTDRPSGECYEKCLYGECNVYGDCSYGCAYNRYGWDCSMYCSSNCLDAQCDSENGFCLHGCVNGTEGAFCEDYCPQGCYSEWMWGCDTSRDYYDCPYNQTCFQCGCQGWECVTNGTLSSSAPVTAATPLLAVLSFAACGALLTLLLG